MRISELKQILVSLGEAMNPREVDALTRDLKVDQEGYIRYDEFIDQLVQ
jgi:Ca2+-binding EF-hand superfamily protein